MDEKQPAPDDRQGSWELVEWGEPRKTALEQQGMAGREDTSSKGDTRKDHDPRLHPGAALALVLAFLAVALMLPMTPWAVKAIAAPVPDNPPHWVFVTWFMAPFVGILSLVQAGVARRTIMKRPTELTGHHLITAAKSLAWSAAVWWWFVPLAMVSQMGDFNAISRDPLDPAVMAVQLPGGP